MFVFHQVKKSPHSGECREVRSYSSISIISNKAHPSYSAYAALHPFGTYNLAFIGNEGGNNTVPLYEQKAPL